MTLLSVVVTVFNGEKYLAECLASVKDIASEIIVVDHQSSDKSLSIAKKFTKKVYSRPNDVSSIDLQKNYGFEKATGDWILSLDADEAVTQELIHEIRSIIDGQSSILSGYYIPRKNIIFGKWIEHTGWYPDYQLRLFKRGKGKYTKKHVHEQIMIDGEVGKLINPLHHEAYQTVYQFLHRGLTVYAPNEAEALRVNEYAFSYKDTVWFPFQEFLRRYFAREGYKDGFHGLVLSLLMAAYHLAVFLYLWEYEKFPSSVNPTVLLANQITTMKTEWSYWTTTMRINQAKNPATKILLKAKRKLHV